MMFHVSFREVGPFISMHECLGRVIARMILADIIKVLEDGDLETVGREDYGTLADRLTAHPKIDPVTGLISNPKLQKLATLVVAEFYSFKFNSSKCLCISKFMQGNCVS
jgi:hypothetical protein